MIPSRILHEVQLFVQTETQRSIFRRDLSLLGDSTISNRYAAIEQRLTSVLYDAEVCEYEGEDHICTNVHTIPLLFLAMSYRDTSWQLYYARRSVSQGG